MWLKYYNLIPILKIGLKIDFHYNILKYVLISLGFECLVGRET